MIVSVFIMGGLGNQLFEIFTTISYAIRSRRKFIFPYSESVGNRYTFWNSFLSRLKFFTTFHKSEITNENIFAFPKFQEQSFRYNEIPLFKEESILLHGHYQSYLYFEKDFKQICSLIQWNEQQEQLKLELMNYHKYQDICTDYSVSMHFRLGDYKNLPDHHPIMKYSYYEASIQCILSKRESVLQKGVSCLVVYYFCEKEDNFTVLEVIDKLKAKFSILEFVKVDDTFEDWKQMMIMSCCRDNIIANSTFSWWGAYLNQNEDKIVCFPSKWFGPLQRQDTRDLCPPQWNRIEINE